MSVSLYNSISHLKNPVRSEINTKIFRVEESILQDLHVLSLHIKDSDLGQRVAIDTLRQAWPYVTEDYASEAVTKLSDGNENVSTANFQVLTTATALIHKITFWGDAKRKLDLVDRAIATNQPEMVYPKEQEEKKETSKYNIKDGKSLNGLIVLHKHDNEHDWGAFIDFAKSNPALLQRILNSSMTGFAWNCMNPEECDNEEVLLLTKWMRDVKADKCDGESLLFEEEVD